MKYIFFLLCLLPGQLAAQTGLAYSPQAQVYSPLTDAANRYTVDSLAKAAAVADQQYSFVQLAQLLEACKKYAAQSKPVAENLAAWLSEGHPIYAEKGYNETQQFRAYLLYMLSFFSPTDELGKYLRYELEFADNNNVTGAAIYTAKRFLGDSTIAAIVEKYNTERFDIGINFYSPDVLASYEKTTTLRKEALATLGLLRPSAPKARPSCCDKEGVKKNHAAAQLIPVKNRLAIKGPTVFYDQYGKELAFGQLKGRPFLITFFYTSCTNPKKCANTIQQLHVLQTQLQSTNAGSVGIYPISYDIYIDKPDVLKKYGDAYGFSFTGYHKFLVPQSEDHQQKLFQMLGVKVGYGNGIVTQHATQLFLFDKKGRIAMKVDNEAVTPDLLLRALAQLKAE